MSGGLMQLVAYGAQDVYLTGNPQITFFKVAYRRHTNFAMQAMTVVASGASGFDKIMNFTIPRNGDLIMNTYLKAQIRDVEPEAGSDHAEDKFCWVKRLGHALIDYATLTIGGSQIDKQYGMWLDIWYELTHSKAQEKGYKQMIGEVDELTKFSTVKDGKKGYTLFVPLQFWFCRNPGLALPLIALQYHEVKVELKTAHKDKLICCTEGFKATQAYRHLSLGDVTLLVNYVFLDSEERRKFAQVGHEYLIEQLQFTGSVPVPNTIRVNKDSEVHHSVPLNFNHPSKELVWAVRNGNTSGKKFLAYTSDADWSAALDDAATNVAYAMFLVADASATPAPDANKYVEYGTDDCKTIYPNLNVTVSEEASEGAAASKLYVKRVVLAPHGNVARDLAKKVGDVEIVIKTEDSGKSIESVTVYTHSFTVRDISIPLEAFVDTRESSQKLNDIIVNIPFNYGMLIDGSVNPVAKALLQFNGSDRFDEREGMFFNCVQPFQHHTCTPADGINVYSFALTPENHQPSGTANLSRIDTTYLQLKYKDATIKFDEDAALGYFNSDSQLFVFDLSYNVLRVLSGMAGVAYSN